MCSDAHSITLIKQEFELKNFYLGLDFFITDLSSVLIQIIADQILNDSLCCSYKYN